MTIAFALLGGIALGALAVAGWVAWAFWRHYARGR